MQALNTSPIRYYLDRQGSIQKDTYNGPLASIIRKISSLWRDYNLFHVYNELSKQADSNSTPTITSADVVEISYQFPKYAGFDEHDWNILNGLAQNENITEENFNKFLERIEGNKVFNAAVANLLKNTKNHPFFGTNKILEQVLAYSHKTEATNYHKMIVAVDIAKNHYAAKMPEEARLTIQQVRSLESLAKLKPILKEWKKLCPGLNTTKFTKLNESAAIAKAFIDTAVRQANDQLTPSCIKFCVYDIETDYALRGQRVSWLQQFIFKYILGTNISHISVIYQDRNNNPVEAHMWGSPVSKFSQSKRTLGNHCFRTFTLDPKKLVKDTNHEKMALLYGDKWADIIAAKYTEILRDYFDTAQNPDLQRLRNPSLRRLFAAIGFRFSWFKKSWEERAQFPDHKEVICSEFAVLSPLQCLVKLNEKIKADWNNRDGAAPKLRPPVRKHRRTNRIVPHEILQRAIDTGTGTIEDQAPVIRNIIKCNTAPLMY